MIRCKLIHKPSIIVTTALDQFNEKLPYKWHLWLFACLLGEYLVTSTQICHFEMGCLERETGSEVDKTHSSYTIIQNTLKNTNWHETTSQVSTLHQDVILCDNFTIWHQDVIACDAECLPRSHTLPTSSSDCQTPWSWSWYEEHKKPRKMIGDMMTHRKEMEISASHYTKTLVQLYVKNHVTWQHVTMWNTQFAPKCSKVQIPIFL